MKKLPATKDDAQFYVMDSAVWVEYFRGSKQIHTLVIDSLRTNRIVVPAVCMFEVAFAVERGMGEEAVKIVLATMREQRVDALTADRAIAAARYRQEYRLGMADAMVYASAVALDAILLTLDRDFEGLPNVMYVKLKH